MRVGKLLLLSAALFGTLSLPLRVAAADLYTLEFLPTANAPGAQATMTLKVVGGETIVHFRLRGAHPHTVYTIWTVLKVLTEPLPETPGEVPSGPPPAADPLGRPFPAEANGVSPLARLDDAFTSGMGLDPGAAFVTNERGDAEVQVKLDYDLVRDAPLSNKDVIEQCVPGPLGGDGKCPDPLRKMKVTSTWLRTYIGQVTDPAMECANYDPESVLPQAYWQCIDPATVDPRTGNGLPRVPRFTFNHFRLAAHPDALTHGFIGGNHEDHVIDMVGRHADLVPKP